jgi:hypothetical protein
MSDPVRLTRRQAAIIGAFTGVTCGPFEDIHEYVDSLPGFKGITTLGFASKDIAEQIREASRADFISLCSDRSDPK